MIVKDDGSSASFILGRHKFDSLPLARDVTFLKVSELHYPLNEDHYTYLAGLLELMLAILFNINK